MDEPIRRQCPGCGAAPGERCKDDEGLIDEFCRLRILQNSEEEDNDDADRYDPGRC